MRTEVNQAAIDEANTVRYRAPKELFEEWTGKQNWLLVSEKNMEWVQGDIPIQMRYYLTPAGKKVKVLFSGHIVTEVQRL